MTNRELFFKTFPCLEQDKEWPNLLWWTDEKDKRQLLGDVYDSYFWDEEYKGPTTKNDLENVIDAMEYRTNALIENIKSEIMHFANAHCSGDDINIYDVFKVIDDCCEAENPTTKNDLGVDCIDKAELLKAMDTWDKFGLDSHGYMRRITKDKNTDLVPYVHYEAMVNCIKGMPSVTPIRPKGHWISRWHAGHDLHFHVCSECNEEFSCDMETGISIDNYRYCPNCGAKMESEEI